MVQPDEAVYGHKYQHQPEGKESRLNTDLLEIKDDG